VLIKQWYPTEVWTTEDIKYLILAILAFFFITGLYFLVIQPLIG
jgi:hypothetical protein